MRPGCGHTTSPNNVKSRSVLAENRVDAVSDFPKRHQTDHSPPRQLARFRSANHGPCQHRAQTDTRQSCSVNTNWLRGHLRVFGKASLSTTTSTSGESASQVATGSGPPHAAGRPLAQCTLVPTPYPPSVLQHQRTDRRSHSHRDRRLHRIRRRLVFRSSARCNVGHEQRHHLHRAANKTCGQQANHYCHQGHQTLQSLNPILVVNAQR